MCQYTGYNRSSNSYCTTKVNFKSKSAVIATMQSESKVMRKKEWDGKWTSESVRGSTMSMIRVFATCSEVNRGQRERRAGVMRERVAKSKITL